MNAIIILGLALAGLAIAIMIHHLIKHGYLIDSKDVESHEFAAGIIGFLGFGLLMGASVKNG